MTTRASSSPVTHRFLYVVLTMVLGAAAAGYFTGLTQVAPERSYSASTSQPTNSSGLPAATRYADMHARDRGPNRNWKNELSRLATTRPALTEQVNFSPDDRATAVVRRAKRRAFDGAPPVVPHPIIQQSAASCLACHAEGLRVGDLAAPKLSHAAYANCIQCHVESISPVAGEDNWAVNGFGGVLPVPGQRAWIGAPPTIPHPMLMRSECMSCHGLLAEPGMRTTHPWRQSCTQCHAPSSPLDHPAANIPETRP